MPNPLRVWFRRQLSEKQKKLARQGKRKKDLWGESVWVVDEKGRFIRQRGVRNAYIQYLYDSAGKLTKRIIRKSGKKKTIQYDPPGSWRGKEME